jgi:tRNA pseudouridine32 synthase/23S rRNA pseudouridine746 synthase
LSAPLPMRDGVSPSYVWLPQGHWPTLLDFLLQRFPDVGAAIWISRMARGEVVAGDGQRQQPDSPFIRGKCIYYYRELEHEADIPFRENILYRDQHILVADKPHFLPVIPSGRFLRQTLLVRLKQATGLEQLTPIHRLDRETAGVIIFSLNPASRGAYQALFQSREMRKQYQALAGLLPDAQWPLIRRSRIEDDAQFFRSCEVPGEANAETRIELQAHSGQVGQYLLQPVSGRKHQLRVHLAALGIPILNDSLYPTARACGDDDFTRPLQLLAKSIAFIDPLSGQARYFESRQQLLLPACSN